MDKKKRLTVVLILTGVYMAAEVLGGILTHSLALLADAGHMLTDVAGLAISLFAITVAERPADSKRTFGYYRAEILASFVNSAILILISFFILVEAYDRIRNPTEIKGPAMLIVAAVGLIVNFAGIFILRPASDSSINMKGAYFEVLSDLLTSVGVTVAAVVIWFTGWNWVDALLSAAIGLFILPRTWVLLKESVGVLLEGTPLGIDIEQVRKTMLSISGVEDIHDLHIWSLTSGVHALSAHITISHQMPFQSVLAKSREKLISEHRIAHVTLQPELADFKEDLTNF